MTSAFLKPASMSPSTISTRLAMLDGLSGLGSTPTVKRSSCRSGASGRMASTTSITCGSTSYFTSMSLSALPGDGGAGGGHGGHRVALVERLLAGHDVPDHVLVVHHHLAGRDELRRLVGEVVAGDHGLHAGQRLGLGGVDRHDARVRVRAAQHAADELAGQVEVRAEARAAGDLVDAVRADRARADVALPVGPVRAVLGHGYPFLIATAASFTALHDLVVAGAPAQVAGQPVADLGVGRIRVLLEQRLAGHDEAGRADPALQRGVLQELLLQRMERLRPWPRPRWSRSCGRPPRSPARGTSRPAGRPA